MTLVLYGILLGLPMERADVADYDEVGRRLILLYILCRLSTLAWAI